MVWLVAAPYSICLIKMRVIYPFPKTASIIEVFTKIHPHCDGKQIAYLTSRPDLERQLVPIYSAWATI